MKSSDRSCSLKIHAGCIHISRDIKASCRDTWEIITDTSQWPLWGPSVAEVECTERFITKGTRGRIKTTLGLWVNFEITGFEEGRSWSWHVAGFPATGHRIEESEDRVCRLVFEVPLLAAPYAIVCNRALNRIADLLER